MTSAADRGHDVIVRALLVAGAELNHADKEGWTALMSAAGRGHDEIVRALQEAGADVNHANNRARTALTLAAAEPHCDRPGASGGRGEGGPYKRGGGHCTDSCAVRAAV